MRTAPVVLFAAAALATAAPSSATVISSTFDSGTDGWTFVGDPGSTLTFNPSSPVNGGAAQLNEADQGATDYFVAPDKFLGDLSAFYRGRLFADALSVAPGIVRNSIADGDFIFAGSAGTLFGFFPTNVNSVLPLDETFPFHFNSADGPIATAADVQSVLANVTSIRIRADLGAGPETAYLSTFQLVTPDVAIPTPTAFPAGLAFLAALPFAAQRVRRS